VIEEDEGRGKMESRGRLEMYRRRIREKWQFDDR